MSSVRLLATEVIRGKLWDAANLNDTEIDGIFAVNNQVVIFLQQLVKYKPNLYRLVLDGNNGKLIQEDKLGELPAYGITPGRDGAGAFCFA